LRKVTRKSFAVTRSKLRHEGLGGAALIPASFDYVLVQSVAEAVAFLDQRGEDAEILAGGHSLIPLLRFRLAWPSVLVDINRIEGLEYIRETDGVLRIGALTRQAELERSLLVRERYPILFETASGIADPVVRNWATLGGNIAHADPANDHPATMLALGASVAAVSPGGERVIPIEEFFTDTSFETSRLANELLTEIRVPAPLAGSGGAYVKLKRKVGDYAIAGVAAYLTLESNGTVRYAGLGLTNVGPVPIKARSAEGALLGKPPDEAHIHLAAELAAAATNPASDSRGPADYKRAMTRTLTVRALRAALARATGDE
jgi:carbon-monoxide dehydrogenase medium subunit